MTRKKVTRAKWFFIQMDLKVLMTLYGKDCTFEELKKMGVLN